MKKDIFVRLLQQCVKHYSVKDVALWLNVSKTSIRRWAKEECRPGHVLEMGYKKILLDKFLVAMEKDDRQNNNSASTS